jgi:hypothetical protein
VSRNIDSSTKGNLVYEATAEGGTIEWDTYAFGKYAASVYMILFRQMTGCCDDNQIGFRYSVLGFVD